MNLITKLEELRFATLIVLLVVFTNINGQCPSDDILLETQSDVDNFATDYPDCTALEGNLSIISNSITNLNGLNGISSIGGTLYIANTQNMTDLSGLESLIEVGGIDIQSNEALVSLNGLNNLTTINGSLELGYCFALIDISQLLKLESISGRIYFRYIGISSLYGIDNIDYTSITSLELWSLSNLSNSNVASVCNYVNNEGACTLSDNPEGFNSASELSLQCVTTFKKIEERNAINLFPNPTNEEVNITGIGANNYKYKILTLAGVVAKSGKITNNGSISLSQLSNGIYYLVMQLDGENVVKTIIKEK